MQDNSKRASLREKDGINKGHANTTDNEEEEDDAKQRLRTELPVPTHGLPYNGAFYKGAKLTYRGADVPEIRRWSSMDPQSPQSVYDCINEVVKTTVRGVDYRDIKECDRMKFLCYVHDLTFNEPEQPIKFPYKCPSCGTEHVHELIADNITYKLPPKKYDKYIDPTKGVLSIATKSYGVLEFAPPSIGVSAAIAKWIETLDVSTVKQHQKFFEYLPYVVHSWKDCSHERFEKEFESYMSWDKKQLATIFGIFDDVSITMSDRYSIPCSNTENCKHVGTPKVSFGEGGIKAFFLPVSNIDNELS